MTEKQYVIFTCSPLAWRWLCHGGWVPFSRPSTDNTEKLLHVCLFLCENYLKKWHKVFISILPNLALNTAEKQRPLFRNIVWWTQTLELRLSKMLQLRNTEAQLRIRGDAGEKVSLGNSGNQRFSVYRKIFHFLIFVFYLLTFMEISVKTIADNQQGGKNNSVPIMQLGNAPLKNTLEV